MNPLLSRVILASTLVLAGCGQSPPQQVAAPRPAPTPAPAVSDLPAAPAPAPAPVAPAPASVPEGVADTPSGWQAAGWGGGAYYYAAAWHPTDPDVIYLGGDCTGAYRSDDQGLHWSFINDGICNYAVYCLAVSPAAPDLVYALTDGGLCKSTDRGAHWTVVDASAATANNIRSQRDGSVRAVAIDPHDAQVVYAGSRDGRLWKSGDGAATWSELDYRSALPEPPAAPAFTGSGAIRATYDGTAAGDSMGRLSRLFGDGKAQDWSAYRTLSVRFRVPAGAPALQAQVVVQTGENWQWQQGEWVDGEPGAWVEVPLDLARLEGMASVRMVHIAVRTFQDGWKGDVLFDGLVLAAAPEADGDVPTRVVADWEGKGDAGGWTANSTGEGYRRITAVHQTQAATDERGTVSSVAIAGDGALYVSNTRLGVFRSGDGGGSWTRLDTPECVRSVSPSPSDPARLWAACGADGARVSRDHGRTWTRVALGGKPEQDVREVVEAPGHPQRVYAIASAGWNGTLFASDDGGVSWRSSRDVRPDRPGNPTLPKETPCLLSSVKNIAINPHDPDQVFIAGNWRNVFSGDGGRTLEERSTGADNTVATDIQFHAGKVYATAMDSGLLVSANGGETWRQLLPLAYDEKMSGHFWRVRVATVDGAERIVTTCSPWKSYDDPSCANRAYLSTDGGASFTLSQAGLPDYVPSVNCMWGRSFPRCLAQHPSDPSILYLGMDGDPEPEKGLPGGGIFRSADGGRTWTRCAGQPGGRRLYYGLVVDPSDPKRLYYSCCGSGGGAWRSDDEGATWTRIFDRETWCFNLDVTPSGVVLVGGKNLWRSDDRGATWTQTTRFTDDATVVGIEVDPTDEGRIWISRTTWGSGTRGGIWRSTDGGANWEEITGDIPYRKPQILRYDPTTRELWAAGSGIFKLAQ